MRTFCITHRIDRCQLARERFHGCGLDVKFFQGFDGVRLGMYSGLSHGTDAVVPSEYVANSGTIGCFLSHAALWRALLAMDVHGNTLILEDDAVLSDDLATVLGDLAIDTDILYVGYVDSQWGPLGTHAYVVNRRALEVLVEEVADCRVGVDVMMIEWVLSGGRVTWSKLPKSLVGQLTAQGLMESTTRH